MLGVSALALTVACSATPAMTASNMTAPAQQLASQAGVPVVVSCEPGQRTVVRPAVINGAAVSQVECIASQQMAPAGFGTTPQPAYYAPAAVQPQPIVARRVSQPVYTDLADAQVGPVSNNVMRPVQTRQVIEERPVRRTRSVAKSAVIIGSSAGAGAGVGAAVGGKKGALIGAAIGGGGAAVWDQITRRK